MGGHTDSGAVDYDVTGAGDTDPGGVCRKLLRREQIGKGSAS